jgi:LPPG:FO 2-phospho-L-lactate transferase
MSGRIVVLTGGVGGAKLVLGLVHAVTAESVTAIVNTADDFRHLGLPISPDIDTLLYTLSGKANRAQGWGREGETWKFMEAVRELGGPDWFALGDGDLAMHVMRSVWRSEGLTLSGVTGRLARRLGIASAILPMSDEPVATQVMTDDGELEFQRYFVEQRCVPIVRSIGFAGAEAARPAPGVIEALVDPDTRAILIAPSNPYLSVDPVLAVPGIRAALADATAPVVAISPIVGGEAVKGPTAKIMRELGLSVSAQSVADHYVDFLDAMLIDAGDPEDLTGFAQARAETLMTTLADKVRVAQAALALADSLRA